MQARPVLTGIAVTKLKATTVFVSKDGLEHTATVSTAELSKTPQLLTGPFLY